MGDEWGTILRVLGTIAALVLVLFLAWLLLRWMNKRMPGMSGSGKMIKVLDRTAAGKNSSILLLRVEDKVLLVAISEHAIEKLCEFDDPDEQIKPPPTPDYPSFSSTLRNATKNLGRPKDKGDRL
ncbi:MAG: flagellar biosynthetic protein FliO [Ruminococcaceae bacterium]|nr:flagellar biosynthetic protein FliO [Oscillospiraceae bacterium]